MMLELLHKKSNALQAVYERNKVLAKYLAEDDIDEAMKQLAYCNQLVKELSDIENRLYQMADDKIPALSPQKERQARMERSMQKVILTRLQGLMEQNAKALKKKTEAARQNVKTTHAKRDGLKAYASVQEANNGVRLDASR